MTEISFDESIKDVFRKHFHGYIQGSGAYDINARTTICYYDNVRELELSVIVLFKKHDLGKELDRINVLRKRGYDIRNLYTMGFNDRSGLRNVYHIQVSSQTYLTKLCRDIKKVMAEERK